MNAEAALHWAMGWEPWVERLGALPTAHGALPTAGFLARLRGTFRRHGLVPSPVPRKVTRKASTPSTSSRTSRAKAPRSLHATIDGTCALRIPSLPSPPPLDGYVLRCEIEFAADRLGVTLHDFEPIVTPEYPAKIGMVSVTNSTIVHLRSAAPGTLSRDGHVEIPVVLHFDHSFDAPFVEEDSDLALTLSTRDVGGQPLDARGHITLVGAGTFEGGHLAGRRCEITYDAAVAPMPW